MYNVFCSRLLPQCFLLFLISADAFLLPSYNLFCCSVFFFSLLSLPSAFLPCPVCLLCLPLHPLLFSDPLNLIRIVYRNMGKVLSLEMLTRGHWLQYWRERLALSHTHGLHFCFQGGTGPSPLVDRPNLVPILCW